MKLIVGLGNPGKEYDNTRHNIGFMVLDKFYSGWKEKFQALYTEENINGEKVIFVKPLTFMNLSGNAVIKFVNYYDIDIKDILIIHDDKDIAFGKYKMKINSSSGGHNGIKSIIANLNSEGFARLKIGIGCTNNGTINHVLGKFGKNEMNIINDSFQTYYDIINSFITFGIERTMNVYNISKVNTNEVSK